jgi:hypothetical protein
MSLSEQRKASVPSIVIAGLIVALTMITAGCAEKERYPERYLNSINLTIHPERPMEVSGFLREGVSPDNTLEYPDLTGTCRISFSCSREDSSRLDDILERTGSTPIQITSDDGGLPAHVRYWQEGLNWKPVYSWEIMNDSCTFSARVILTNSTGREWFSQNTVLMDHDDNPICSVPDTLLIRNGDMELGWWRAHGRVLPLTLYYGWPVESQWNQLQPCLTPGAGPLTDTRWPLRSGDTLWIEPLQPLELNQTVHVNSSGYDYTVTLHNQTGSYTEVMLLHPDRTPRGARFQAEEELPRLLGLQPGDLVVLEYSLVYD